MDELERLQHHREIGQRLKKLRRGRALTLRDLAIRLGVKFQTISRWEIGNMPMGEDTLRRVSNFFNVRPEWLATGVEPQQPEILGPTPWPVDDLRREWGVDLPTLPSSWPEFFRQFLAAAVTFGMFPSVSGLATMLDRAEALGTNAPLPRELELAVRIAHGADPRQDLTLTERYFAGMDALIDTVEEAGRKFKKE